jgi:hypothetical protein
MGQCANPQMRQERYCGSRSVNKESMLMAFNRKITKKVQLDVYTDKSGLEKHIPTLK